MLKTIKYAGKMYLFGHQTGSKSLYVENPGRILSTGQLSVKVTSKGTNPIMAVGRLIHVPMN